MALAQRSAKGDFDSRARSRIAANPSIPEAQHANALELVRNIATMAGERAALDAIEEANGMRSLDHVVSRLVHSTSHPLEEGRQGRNGKPDGSGRARVTDEFRQQVLGILVSRGSDFLSHQVDDARRLVLKVASVRGQEVAIRTLRAARNFRDLASTCARLVPAKGSGKRLQEARSEPDSRRQVKTWIGNRSPFEQKAIAVLQQRGVIGDRQEDIETALELVESIRQTVGEENALKRFSHFRSMRGMKVARHQLEHWASKGSADENEEAGTEADGSAPTMIRKLSPDFDENVRAALQARAQADLSAADRSASATRWDETATGSMAREIARVLGEQATLQVLTWVSGPSGLEAIAARAGDIRKCTRRMERLIRQMPVLGERRAAKEWVEYVYRIFRSPNYGILKAQQEEILGILEKLATKFGREDALLRLVACRGLGELRTMLQRAGLANRVDVDPVRQIAPSLADEMAGRLLGPHITAMVQALVDELPQYRDDAKFEAKRCLRTALDFYSGDPARQQQVLDAAIEAWGVNDLTLRLQKVHGVSETEGEIEDSRKRGRPILYDEPEEEEQHNTGWNADERTFLLALGIGARAMQKLSENDRDARKTIREQLEQMVSLAPDRARAREYVALLQERFGGDGTKRRTDRMARKRKTSESQIRTQVNDALFAFIDLARWAGMGESQSDVGDAQPVPRADRVRVMAAVEAKTDPLRERLQRTQAATARLEAAATTSHVPAIAGARASSGSANGSGLAAETGMSAGSPDRSPAPAARPLPKDTGDLSLENIGRILIIGFGTPENEKRMADAVQELKNQNLFAQLNDVNPRARRFLALRLGLDGKGIRPTEGVWDILRVEEEDPRLKLDEIVRLETKAVHLLHELVTREIAKRREAEAGEGAAADPSTGSQNSRAAAAEPEAPAVVHPPANGPARDSVPAPSIARTVLTGLPERPRVSAPLSVIHSAPAHAAPAHATPTHSTPMTATPLTVAHVTATVPAARGGNGVLHNPPAGRGNESQKTIAATERRKPSGSNGFSGRAIAKVLDLDPTEEHNHPKLQEALARLKSGRVFSSIRKLDRDIKLPLYVLELRFLSGKRIPYHHEVAEQLNSEGRSRHHVTSAQVRRMEQDALLLLQGFVESM